MELLSGHNAFIADGPIDGLDFLFGAWDYCADAVTFSSGLAHEVDLCLSGPDEYISGRSSPWRGCTALLAHDMLDGEQADAASPVVAGGSEEPETLAADGFINIFKKTLPQPLLSAPPRAHVTRAEKARVACRDQIPKRSACLAAKSKNRLQKPKAHARKVMMRRIGVEVEMQLPDEASFDKFQMAFKLLLSPTTREATEVLFPGMKQRARRPVRAA